MDYTWASYVYLAAIFSIREMLCKNPDLRNFTYQTDHHEPNLSFHLAIELWKYFPWLKCDFDVKKTAENKRPDLIFHRRGTSDLNSLVVEVKRNRSRGVNEWECRSDEQKIRDFWFAEGLHYAFGLSVVIDEVTFEFAFTLLQNAGGRQYGFGPKHFEDEEFDLTELHEVIGQIIDIKMNDFETDVSSLQEALNRTAVPFFGIVFN
jgi:hypothetical protein